MTTTPQSAEAQERAQFEAECKARGWDCLTDIMQSWMFDAWRARASLPSAAASGEASEVQEAEAWMHEEDRSRVISNVQKQQALKDGGASASSVRPYSIKLSTPTPAVEGLTADVERAKKTIARLCDKGLLSMSIPVRPDDEDMVLMRIISAALAASPVPMASSAGKFSCYLERDHGKAPCDHDCGKLRCMYPSTPAASLREQEDAARYRWLRDPSRIPDGEGDGHLIVADGGGEDVLWAEQLDKTIDTQRLGREKEQDRG